MINALAFTLARKDRYLMSRPAGKKRAFKIVDPMVFAVAAMILGKDTALYLTYCEYMKLKMAGIRAEILQRGFTFYIRTSP